LKNEFAGVAGGAGVQTAQLMVNLKVEAVIAGNFGPNALNILNQAGIKMVQAQGKVSDAALKYARGELKSLGPETVKTSGSASNKR
jgi:predicted Fe-Mo cluster-binding NifX family protein